MSLMNPSAYRWFVGWTVLFTILFGVPLTQLTVFSLNSSLFSHVLLIPFVSAYLIWKRPAEAVLPEAKRTGWAALPAGLSLAGLSIYWTWLRRGEALATEDYLSLMTACYLGLLLAGALATLGWGIVRALSFPILFLLFMIPWPVAMIDGIEMFLQLASAEATHGYFLLAGLPFYREGQVFELPGITLRVAQECSGVRSSLVLFITSVLAGHLLLRARWRRWVLALAVIPLGILRNGFRILVIALLCVHIDPDMIHSVIHKRGGPLFFVLSLIPFFLLLIWLRHGEKRGAEGGGQRSEVRGQRSEGGGRRAEV